MKALVCELCGSNQFMKENGLFVCQSCGTQYTTEEAKKLMIEGKVSIDNRESMGNYRKLARRARETNDNKTAEKYYSLLLEQDPNDWEANFFSVYYCSMECVIANIESACNAVSNVLETTFRLILSLETDEEKNEALGIVAKSCASIATMMQSAATNHYKGIDASIQSRYKYELDNRKFAAAKILITYMRKIEKANLKNNPVLRKNMTTVAENLEWFDDVIAFESLLGLVEPWEEYDYEAAQKYRKKYSDITVKTQKDSLHGAMVWLGISAFLTVLGIILKGHQAIMGLIGLTEISRPGKLPVFPAMIFVLGFLWLIGITISIIRRVKMLKEAKKQAERMRK